MHQDLNFVETVLSGNRDARKQLVTQVHGPISSKTEQLCRRFCFGLNRHYQCTLQKPLANLGHSELLCEWGNASYAWMLNELTKNERLEKYAGRNDASLYDYLFVILNSQAFYERWKDWRFARRVYVPTYIAELDEQSSRIFQELVFEKDLAFIAAKLNMPLDQVTHIVDQIIIQLSQRAKLHLLDPPQETLVESEEEFDSVVNPVETDILQSQQLKQAWSSLTPVEQFVIESLCIDEYDAKSVLRTLQTVGYQLNDKVDNDNLDIQQLYYLKRKALKKLFEQMNQDSNN